MRFWRKQEPGPQPKKRGPYRKRSPEQKANELLAKSWYKYLEQHPNYTQEIAKAKFGIPDSPNNDGYERPDLIEQIHNVREAKELFKDEFGQKSGTLASIASIMKELPAVLRELPEALKQLGQQQQLPRQQAYRPPVITDQIITENTKHLPEKPPETEKSPEEALKDMAEAFLNMKPEEAAVMLFEYKEEADDIRGIAYNWLSGKSVEQIAEYLPMVQYIPQFQHLTYLADRLSSKQGRKWLALLLDEFNKLKIDENPMNFSEN